MNEGLIIVPQADNDGKPLDGVKRDVMGRLINAFGGCRVASAEGAWADSDGTLYIEPVNEITTAYEPNDYNDQKLRLIALESGIAGRQIAVYVRYAGGKVEILQIKASVKAA
jgi:hypothetical protein